MDTKDCIEFFGGQIMEEYPDVYLALFRSDKKVKNEVLARYPKSIVTQTTKRDTFELVTYMYRGSFQNGMEPIPLFRTVITHKQAVAFAADLPAMYRYCQEEIRRDSMRES